jgi:hypothetical protein
MAPVIAAGQWPQYVKTVGNVTSNGIAAFADGSGKLLKAYDGAILAAPTNAAEAGWVLVYGADGNPAWANTSSGLESHAAETTTAHGGIMAKATNPGSNGQVLMLNGQTGRPYWGDPVIEGGVNYLVTSGVARVNARIGATNWTVSVSNGTWDGVTATLTRSGMVTIASSDPVSRWTYDRSQADTIGLVDLIDAGGWQTNAHGDITAGDIYNLRIEAYRISIPGVPGADPAPASVAISNLAVWTWTAPAIVGTTNAFEGTTVLVDDPGADLEAVNLRTLETRLADQAAANTPAEWARYPATTNVLLGGRALYLNAQWSLLADGRFCALSYNGRDVFYASMSNSLLAITGLSIGDPIVFQVATNWVTSRPWLEVCTDLPGGIWVECDSVTNTWPAHSNGAYTVTVSNAWPAGAYFRACQTGTNVNSLVATVPMDLRGGLILGGVTRTNWPTPVPGPAGPAGTSTVVIVNAPTITATAVAGETASVTNLGTPQNAVLQFTLPRGEAGPMGTNGMSTMPATWDADEIGTNALYVKVGGQVMERHDTNGITMLHGSLQLYEEDLNCNVRLYDGSRLAPSFTFRGHTNDFGLYARGWNGLYGAGWSMSGAEIGVLHAGGITLMQTNGTFAGRHSGDLSDCTGYPEPLFEAWKTNMQFSALTLTNLIVTPGAISLLDSLNTPRLSLTPADGMTVNDAGGTARTKIGAQSVELRDTSGLKTTSLGSVLKLFDPTSGTELMNFGGLDGSSITCKAPNGYTQYSIDAFNGLVIRDQSQYAIRSVISPYGMTLMTASSQIVFAVDSQGSLKTTVNDMVVTNNGNLTMAGPNGATTLQLVGVSGAIRAASMTLTNSGSTCTLGVTNNALTLNGRTMLATNFPSFNLTNVFAGVTSVLWFANGVCTNKTP